MRPSCRTGQPANTPGPVTAARARRQLISAIGDGATTGQSYEDFVAGFSRTGAQAVSENWESGYQVNFDLAATDSRNGVTQQYTGTDTVQNGNIVVADVVQTS